MDISDFLFLFSYFIILGISIPLLGGFMAQVFQGKKNFLTPVVEPLEKWIYRLGKIPYQKEMTWREYAKDLLIFNFLGLVVLLFLLLFQGHLPLNPEKKGNVPFGLALNTAISFMTNTNWQAYSGEQILSYASQMLGLAVQNFLSAATGMCVAITLIRGIVRRQNACIGNFWVDLTRSVLYILLPLSIVLSVFLMSQGVIQNFSDYAHVTTLEGAEQVIPMGPVASQVAIKQLGTNGGGFLGANSTHPYENPTPFSNFLQTLAILLIPAAFTYTFGSMVGYKKEGWAILAAMIILFTACLSIALWAELAGNPTLDGMAFLEGKEVRFGIVPSILWGTATTAASNGSVNSMHSSFSPLAGLIMILNMMFGEVVFGGVGAGLYGMLMFVILTVFIAGLMVGRTPEYLGKKIEAREIKMAILAVLAPSAIILVFSAIACVSKPGLSSMLHRGTPHGLSEVLYAFTSAANNNGSAFAGLNANTAFYNCLLGLSMLIGRFMVIIPVLVIAGSLGVKKYIPPSSGTFATDNGVFVILLIAMIVIVGALVFFPALALGPIVEHLLMISAG